MTMAGGNTPRYEGDGRLRMALKLQREWPNDVQVVRRYGRPTHFVEWAKFRRYPVLRLRPEADLPHMAEVDEHMTLKAIKPVQSAELAELLEEFSG